jgi:hypothetical protein
MEVYPKNHWAEMEWCYPIWFIWLVFFLNLQNIFKKWDDDMEGMSWIAV